MINLNKSGVSFFEIGGELIELESDFRYGTGDISAKKRKQHRATARDVKSIGKSIDKISKEAQGMHAWGPAEQFGYGFGFGVGVIFAVWTLPVTQADGPWIGPADAAWAAASLRFMHKSVRTGGQIGRSVDDAMGWE
jgi:hypothetical protein